MKTYRGRIADPADAQTYQLAVVTVDDGKSERPLKPKNEEVGFAWGNPYEGAGPGQLGMATAEEADKIRQRQRNRAAGINQTILAIMTDLLGSEEEAVKVYQRMKHRTVLMWPHNQPWSVTEAQLRKHLEAIEQIEMETAPLRRSHFAKDVVTEGGAGIIWDTDVDGRRRG